MALRPLIVVAPVNHVAPNSVRSSARHSVAHQHLSHNLSVKASTRLDLIALQIAAQDNGGVAAITKTIPGNMFPNLAVAFLHDNKPCVPVAG